MAIKIEAATRLLAAEAAPLTKAQKSACADAKKAIEFFIKNQPKMSFADVTKIMGLVYDLADASKAASLKEQ
jgi:hypothetical protein